MIAAREIRRADLEVVEPRFERPLNTRERAGAHAVISIGWGTVLTVAVRRTPLRRSPTAAGVIADRLRFGFRIALSREPSTGEYVYGEGVKGLLYYAEEKDMRAGAPIARARMSAGCPARSANGLCPRPPRILRVRRALEEQQLEAARGIAHHHHGAG